MANKIVRTPTRAEGGITPAEKAQMDLIAQKWIRTAMRTDPIEPNKIVPAIEALYAAADLKKPRVVIVPSPLVMAFAYGASAWIWHTRKSGKNAATVAATVAATRAATYAAARAATDDATGAATYDATVAATRAATYDATDDATRAATYDATYAATDAAEKLAASACLALAGQGGIQCSQRWWNNYQGGNMWGGWSGYLEACRDVLGLKLPAFEKYQAWEDAAIHGGFRVLHEEFCMVSDFPVQIHKDEQNRPHNISGPSHEWRDGWKLYHVHGVKVPGWIIEYPDRISVKSIDDETNAEIRRVMIEKYGQAKYLLNAGAKKINQDDYGILYRRDLQDDEPIVMVRVLNNTPEPDGSLSREEAEDVFGMDAVQRRLDTMRAIGMPVSDEPRFKEYMIRVPADMKTAHQAIAWTFDKTPETYQPSIET